MAAGPASYGMTDTMGRMHSDAQFAGSSSVPAHVEMMGFLGIGNNPMVWDLQWLDNGWAVSYGDFLCMADRIFTGISLGFRVREC